MISLLEKEARDPVEVLRVKLKDSTDTSLLNSQLLQEIKHDYLAKQDSTKGQLDAFVQAHVDEIERASTLLEVGDSVTQIVRNLDALGQSCRQMNDELGDKKLLSGISIARRNLRELEAQIVFYDEMPVKLQELHDMMTGRVGDVIATYIKWQPFDDWRQKMLHELKAASIDKADELANSKAQARVLASMASRLDAIERIHARILSEVHGCLHHCVDVAQRNKPRLADAFRVLELMEKRRRRLADSTRAYLDHTLMAVADLHTPITDRCKRELVTFLTKRVDDMFRFAETPNPNQTSNQTSNPKPSLDSVLEAANHLLMDLEVVATDVVACFPPEIDVLQLFWTTYNAQLETAITRLCAQSAISTAHRLQLVQWIEYYNAEVIKYKRARASNVLETLAQTLMTQYVMQVQTQIDTWVTNIWRRSDEADVAGGGSTSDSGALQSTRPNDIINILKSQIEIAQAWLTGRLVGRVVVACLDALMAQLKCRFEHLAGRGATGTGWKATGVLNDSVDVESLCAFINDTDVLQSKCPELVEEISFAERDVDEKEAFDIFMGDALDATSTEIVKLSVATAELLVHKIFAEAEPDTTQLWFSKRWDIVEDPEPFVELLLATFDDYYKDLQRWISSAFFFSKIVRLCLDQCAREYSNRLLLRTHCIASPQSTSTRVGNDLKHFVAFFTKYASELRRAGIRSLEDIDRAFANVHAMHQALLQASADPLAGTSSTDNNSEESPHDAVVAHIHKLVRSTSTQEAKGATDDKSGKKVKKPKVDKKADKVDKAAKKAAKEAAKAAAKEAAKAAAKKKPHETTATAQQIDQDQEDGNFEVQSLNMADFLGA